MSNPFFDHPVLNSPYEYPGRHWELDSQGQPTQQIINRRRRAEFITPIPKPKKRKEKKATMETYWIPGVNNLKTFGRWAFAAFTEIYQIEADFSAKVVQSFDALIAGAVTRR